MAVATYNIKPSNIKYTNWIEACLAVLITKEGIEPFVYNEIKKFQQNCLAGICYYNRIRPGTVCSSCCTENVVVCPRDRICNAGRGLCSYHKTVAKQYRPAGCPNQICHNLRTDIQNAHRYYGPSYKNTDATQWCTNPWEVAKCFMPPDGYKDVTSPAETDFNGIISVIINYKYIQANISDNLSNKNNIFEKGRNIGRQVRHSPSLEVEDTDLKQYFTDLQNLLSDPKLLAGNKDVHNARKKLLQLQNATLVIDMKQFRQMLDDVAKDIRQDIKEEKDELTKESDKRKLEMIAAMNDSVKQIESTGKASIADIKDALKSAVSDIETQLSVVVSKIKTESNLSVEKIAEESEHGKHQIQQNVESGVKKLKTEADIVVNQITSLTEESKQQIEGMLTASDVQAEDKKYNKLKKEFKEDLAAFHKNRHSTIPLSPLFEENDTPLLDFYLMPSMKVVTMENGKERQTAIKLLSEVYRSGSMFNNEIYVSADAGFGKTAFSKYMTVLWCQAHFPDVTHTEHFNEDSVNAMREFEFIFLVSLRYSADDCSIDDMILNQVVQHVSNSTLYNKDFLREILKRERCLVVLDGLDEWIHPDTCERRDTCIPHRYPREKCTILTTTRPWKLSIIPLSKKQIDKKIELSNLDRDSALELTTRALKKLKGKREIKENESDQEEMRNEAEKLINSYNDFEQVYVPLLLMYIICLWCDGIPLAQTKCGLYMSIIDLLLSRTISKYENISGSDTPQCDKNVPQCFNEQEHCKAYFTFLTTLGELAFQTLFCETTENRLVFDSSIAEKCLKGDNLKLGRHTGIITQDKQTKLTSKILKTSFSHKTVQEFFAALYISTCSDQDKVLSKVLPFCNSIQDILDLSKVFIFISGINAELFSLLSNDLIKVINKDEKTREYRSTLKCEHEFTLKNIQNMFVSCIKEIPESKDLNICLQDLIFDNNCEQNTYYRCLQTLARRNKTNIRSISIPFTRNVSEIIKSCELSDEEIHCQKIRCLGCKEEDIIPLLSTSVICLFLAGYGRINPESKHERISFTDEQCKTFSNSSKLEEINISDLYVSHEFLNYIINVKSIKQIRLENLYCCEQEHPRFEYFYRTHDNPCPGFNIDLSQYSELRKLELYWDNISLCDMNKDESALLHSMRSIEFVWLSRVKMSSALFRRLVEIIEQLEHSVLVYMENCDITPIKQCMDIRDYIHRSKRLVMLNDYKLDEFEMDSYDRFQFITKSEYELKHWKYAWL